MVYSCSFKKSDFLIIIQGVLFSGKSMANVALNLEYATERCTKFKKCAGGTKGGGTKKARLFTRSRF